MQRSTSRSSASLRLALGHALSAAVALFVLTSEPPSASATEGAEFSLHWQAPADCPSEQRVHAAVLELVGDQAPATLRAYANVKREQHGFRIELVTFRAGQRGQRELVAPSCSALVEAVTVILALAIDPELFSRSPSPRADAEALRVDEEKDAQLAPWAASTQGDGGVERRKPPTATPTHAERPALRRPAAATDEPLPNATSAESRALERGSSQQKTRVLASLAGAVEAGAMPGVGFGMNLRVGGRFGRLRLETELSRWLSRRATAGDSSRGAELTLSSVAVWGCWRAIPSRASLTAARLPWRNPAPLIEAGPCAGAELGRLAGSGFGIPEPSKGSSDYAGAGGALRIGATATEWLSFDVRFEGIMLLHRPTFFVEGLGPVHRPDPWSLRASLATEVQFP